MEGYRAQDDRRWLLDHPISGPRVCKAPDNGNYGIAPGKSVWVVPEAQLRWAVERMEQAAALLARVGVGDKPMAAKDGEDIQAAYRILTGGR